MKRQPNKARVPTSQFWKRSSLWAQGRQVQNRNAFAKWEREHPEEAAMVAARRKAA